MPISTRLTELFRIEHPILLAPMDIVAFLGDLGQNPNNC
jgi:hypothetical protein